MKRVLLIMFLAVLTTAASAQKFLWDLDFRMGFDNREYAHMKTQPSGTLFGAILSPRVGLGFGEGHAVYLGGELRRYFGKSAPKYAYEWLLYYQYDGEHLKLNAGVFPMTRLTGEYPLAFQEDNTFFDTVMEGVHVGYERDTWYLEAAVDWTGLPDEETRENFYVYSYGRKDIGMVYGAYSFIMYHFASSYTVKGVVDNLWLYPHIGVQLAKVLPLSEFDIRAGWLQTFQNDRISGNGYVNPGGFQAELRLEKWGVGIHETIYTGPSLLPFFNTPDAAGVPYGTALYSGDRFYGTESGLYNRLELYYAPTIAKVSDYLDFRIAAVLHCDGFDWGWQQLVQVVVNLDSLKFPKKAKSE